VPPAPPAPTEFAEDDDFWLTRCIVINGCFTEPGSQRAYAWAVTVATIR